MLIGDVKAAYFRRPGLPAAHPGIRNQSERQYVVAEWSALLKSLYLALEGRWLNAPWSIFQAEDKPRQLRLAARLGFMVADTVISNDLDAVWRSGAAPRVGKTLRQALLEDEDGPGRVIFTSELPKLDPLMVESFALAPMIVQTKISKRVDVRVTVVGEHLFATEIHSQSSSETETDWRKGADPNLIHRVHELPEDIKRCCLALTHALDLRFGAIDLVLDTKGVYWFLEINPNGQWAWIESRTGGSCPKPWCNCGGMITAVSGLAGLVSWP